MATGHKFDKGIGQNSGSNGGRKVATQALNPSALNWSDRVEYLMRQLTGKDMPDTEVATVLTSDRNLLDVIRELQDIFELLDPEVANIVVRLAAIQIATEGTNTKTQDIKTALTTTNLKLDSILVAIEDLESNMPQLPELPAGTDLLAGRVVYIVNGFYVYSDQSIAASVYGAVGITIADIPNATTFKPRRAQTVTNVTWNWNPVKPIFLGSNGQLTQAPPATGYLLTVGYPLTPTMLYFDLTEEPVEQ
jgi:hypothetical protein